MLGYKRYQIILTIAFMTIIIHYIHIKNLYNQGERCYITYNNTNSINEFKVIKLNLEETTFELPAKNCESLSRNDFTQLVNRELRSLEIGPFTAPSLTGKNVKYFDVLNKQGLIERAKEHNLDPSRIPNIDFVSEIADLKIIKSKFDLVFTAHNIEHQLDLVAHMNDVYNLLNDDGLYYMVIPDRRYCFDHFLPPSLMSEVLNAHHLSMNRHTLRTVLTECETTHNYPNLHWAGNSGVGLYSNHRLECYKTRLNNFFETDKYIDFHQWRFQPENFVFIFNGLYRMGLIKLKLEKVYCTALNSLEFQAVFKKIV